MRSMKITYVNFALLYLFLSFFVFPISAFWPGPSLVLIGDVVIAGLVVGILLDKGFSRDLTLVVVLMMLALAGLFVLTEFKIQNIRLILVSRGLFMFVVTVFFYLYAFSKLTVRKLIRIDSFIERIIQINIVAIVIDGIAINFFGMYNLFGQLFQGKVGCYRVYTNPTTFWDNVANGLVFGAQHASILSVVGILWWFPWNSWRNIEVRQMVWLSGSVFALSFTLTTTSLICLLVPVTVVCCLGLVKNHKLLAMTFVVCLPFLMILHYEDILAIRYQVPKGEYTALMIQRYQQYMFQEPIEGMKKNMFELMIGSGNRGGKELTKAQNQITEEVGFIHLAVQYGAVLTVILLLSYAAYLFNLSKFMRRFSVLQNGPLIMFRAMVVSLALIMASCHYMTIFAPGVRQLFAATIALSYVLMKRYKKVRPKCLGEKAKGELPGNMGCV